ncbi:8-oxo-dGTP diphosphatase [Streptococcus gallinaceus]|uniref:8-oxo-dGTP diphosphatase n=1 Tax=Streptococcus gallinaceus TaxID=165758 RepID=A0ABV2JKS0_9STRE|nr:8-oxo-dGTP diphosphatase [Streptococcus gallinaceus]MCP1639196.1 8-oxo-dGTP diphosphatase [Streptococcus gallinaceus]MCP1770160.1 8-oxo-dGTP diphosphatase [Streptococcus gallinaceus]
MPRSQEVILTNMCLIEDADRKIVMQIRDPERYTWSGAALPGGHIEVGESLHEAVVREVYEETGLLIRNPKLVGMKHWYTKEGVRYLVFLYRTIDFEGQLRSSEEGEVQWVDRADLSEMELAYDLLNLLRVFDEKELSELFYRERLEDDFIREFW